MNATNIIKKIDIINQYYEVIIKNSGTVSYNKTSHGGWRYYILQNGSWKQQSKNLLDNVIAVTNSKAQITNNINVNAVITVSHVISVLINATKILTKIRKTTTYYYVGGWNNGGPIPYSLKATTSGYGEYTDTKNLSYTNLTKISNTDTLNTNDMLDTKNFNILLNNLYNIFKNWQNSTSQQLRYYSCHTNCHNSCYHRSRR